jgi:hypothetical protein
MHRTLPIVPTPPTVQAAGSESGSLDSLKRGRGQAMAPCVIRANMRLAKWLRSLFELVSHLDERRGTRSAAILGTTLVSLTACNDSTAPCAAANLTAEQGTRLAVERLLLGHVDRYSEKFTLRHTLLAARDAGGDPASSRRNHSVPPLLRWALHRSTLSDTSHCSHASHSSHASHASHSSGGWV